MIAESECVPKPLGFPEGLMLYLMRIDGVGRETVWELIKREGSLYEEEDLVERVFRRTKQKIKEAEDNEAFTAAEKYHFVKERLQSNKIINQVNKLVEDYLKQDVWCFSKYRGNCPKSFELIRKQPKIVLGKGKWPNKVQIGVVGTRDCTEYGKAIVKKIVPVIAKYDFVLSTGLADGIDLSAYNEMVRLGGKTLAVLPWNLENIPNYKVKYLENGVKSKGCYISEYSGSLEVTKGNFLRRNKLLCALADLLIVVEAPKTSGALHSVRHMLKYKKDVWAFPGSIFSSSSEGTNRLAGKEGVRMISSISEFTKLIEDRYQLEAKMQERSWGNLGEREQEILKFVGNKVVNIDLISKSLDIEVQIVRNILTNLMLEGIVSVSKLDEVEII